MDAPQELLEVASRLEFAGSKGSQFESLLLSLEQAANDVGKSFSGSWLGYHSRVYFQSFAPPPPGTHFSQEWGFDNPFHSARADGWHEYSEDEIRRAIYLKGGDPSLDEARRFADSAEVEFERNKGEVISILSAEIGVRDDEFLRGLKSEVEGMEPHSAAWIVNRWSPKGQVMTRDTLALGQGSKAPPHLGILAEIQSIRIAFEICNAAGRVARKAGSHIERIGRRQRTQARINTNVFIGHGRSAAWRELKDFVGDRLKLPWDEFNRVPVAGITNISRLSEMLEAAGVALVIMTAEDETAEGELQARMNVIHEVGLFQGRLGFTKAIVLLEEGCAEFSNIQGLGQIRFPKGKISACFEEVRAVLEREGLISS